MSIRAVVFDFGGVVIRTPFEMARGLEGRLGLPAGSVDISGPFDPSADPLWRRFRAGEYPELEYWRRQADRHADLIGAGPDPLRSLMDSLFDAPPSEVLRPETQELRRALSDRGLGAAALTNDLSRFHDRAWIEQMDVLDKFDPFVDLSNSGVLKPDPRGYQRVIDLIGLPPEQLLFIDDQPVNVAGAERVGMEAVHFDVLDPAGSAAGVLARLGFPAPD